MTNNHTPYELCMRQNIIPNPFRPRQRTAGWQIVVDDYNVLPQNIRNQILWRIYPTIQDAFTAAAQYYFQLCGRQQ